MRVLIPSYGLMEIRPKTLAEYRLEAIMLRFQMPMDVRRLITLHLFNLIASALPQVEYLAIIVVIILNVPVQIQAVSSLMLKVVPVAHPVISTGLDQMASPQIMKI